MEVETHVPATFVMPHYVDRPRSVEWLDEAVGGLVAQTEPDWTLVIVDDASPDARARNRLLALSREHAGRVFVVFQERNRGAGACRNTRVLWAKARGSPLVLFNDADDISHPRRLEVVKLIMSPRSAVDFIYSPIVVITYEAKVRVIASARRVTGSRRAWIQRVSARRWLAIHRGQVGSEQEPLLWERFFLRLAQTMRRSGRDDLAEELAGRARAARRPTAGAAPSRRSKSTSGTAYPTDMEKCLSTGFFV